MADSLFNLISSPGGNVVNLLMRRFNRLIFMGLYTEELQWEHCKIDSVGIVSIYVPIIRSFFAATFESVGEVNLG
jgi:hypothetical protein